MKKKDVGVYVQFHKFRLQKCSWLVYEIFVLGYLEKIVTLPWVVYYNGVVL
jgi:hypothetical protein